MGFRQCLVAAVLLLTLGCNPFARKRVPSLPPVPVPPVPREAEPQDKARDFPPPPQIEPDPGGTETPPSRAAAPPSAEPPPPSQPQTPDTVPSPGQQAQPVGPQVVPQLTQLLTLAQMERYNREIDQNLNAVSSFVQAVTQRRLDDQAAIALERVRALALQAAETRQLDLETARGLASRALVLARDLENRTR